MRATEVGHASEIAKNQVCFRTTPIMAGSKVSSATTLLTLRGPTLSCVGWTPHRLAREIS